MSQVLDASSLDVEAIGRALDDVGYVIVRNVIPPDEADRARAALEALLEKERTADTPRTQRVFQIAIKHPVFLELMCHPLVVAVWKKWLGEDVICSTWSGNTMHPGQTTYDWHADYPYWAMTPPWPAGNFTGQTIWMLDDFTAANGATGIIPGSHRRLRPPPAEKRRVWMEEAAIAEAPRGSVVFLHGAMWHSHRPNQTDRPRSALLGMYIRPFCMPMENMRAQLAKLENPSDLVKQLMGANQRQPS